MLYDPRLFVATAEPQRNRFARYAEERYGVTPEYELAMRQPGRLTSIRSIHVSDDPSNDHP